MIRSNSIQLAHLNRSKYREVLNKCCEFVCLDEMANSETMLTTTLHHHNVTSTSGVITSVVIDHNSKHDPGNRAPVHLPTTNLGENPFCEQSLYVFFLCLGLRLVASTITSFLILALLLFLIHRLRQRRLLLMLRRLQDRRTLPPGSPDNEDSNGSNRRRPFRLSHLFSSRDDCNARSAHRRTRSRYGIRNAGMDSEYNLSSASSFPFGFLGTNGIEPPPPYSFWKPPEQQMIGPGEAPPSYEETVAHCSSVVHQLALDNGYLPCYEQVSTAEVHHEAPAFPLHPQHQPYPSQASVPGINPHVQQLQQQILPFSSYPGGVVHHQFASGTSAHPSIYRHNHSVAGSSSTWMDQWNASLISTAHHSGHPFVATSLSHSTAAAGGAALVNHSRSTSHRNQPAQISNLNTLGLGCSRSGGEQNASIVDRCVRNFTHHNHNAQDENGCGDPVQARPNEQTNLKSLLQQNDPQSIDPAASDAISPLSLSRCNSNKVARNQTFPMTTSVPDNLECNVNSNRMETRAFSESASELPGERIELSEVENYNTFFPDPSSQRQKHYRYSVQHSSQGSIPSQSQPVSYGPSSLDSFHYYSPTPQTVPTSHITVLKVGMPLITTSSGRRSGDRSANLVPNTLPYYNATLPRILTNQLSQHAAAHQHAQQSHHHHAYSSSDGIVVMPPAARRAIRTHRSLNYGNDGAGRYSQITSNPLNCQTRSSSVSAQSPSITLAESMSKSMKVSLPLSSSNATTSPSETTRDSSTSNSSTSSNSSRRSSVKTPSSSMKTLVELNNPPSLSTSCASSSSPCTSTLTSQSNLSSFSSPPPPLTMLTSSTSGDRLKLTTISHL